MALVRTVLVSGTAGPSVGNGGSTSGAFDPPDNCILVVEAGLQTNGALGDVSASITVADNTGGALTWTSRAVIGASVDFANAMRAWTAPVVSQGSMTVTVDCGASNINCWFISVVAWTDDAGGTLGTGTTGTNAALGSNGAGTVTLAGSPAATSEIFGGRTGGTSTTGTHAATEGAGYTEIHDLNVTDNAGMQTPGSSGRGCHHLVLVG